MLSEKICVNNAMMDGQGECMDVIDLNLFNMLHDGIWVFQHSLSYWDFLLSKCMCFGTEDRGKNRFFLMVYIK